MTIKAIETEYAGCRFRSRLEARWARFFSHLGIRWNYEPEGLDIDGVRYLPDFQLPDIDNLYVEVKGVMDAAGMEKVLMLASTGRSVLVLRDIPAPDQYGPHHVLYASRPNVQRFLVNFAVCTDGISILPFGWPTFVRGDTKAAVVAHETDVINSVIPSGRVLIDLAVVEAFTAARSARFEHGERG
jgi:hypothetical protein